MLSLQTENQIGDPMNHRPVVVYEVVNLSDESLLIEYLDDEDAAALGYTKPGKRLAWVTRYERAPESVAQEGRNPK